MTYNSVHEIFVILSGEESVDYRPIIELAIDEVERMLLPDADDTDSRLNYLAGSLANYRYHQAICSRENSAVTYAGQMKKTQADASISYAEKLFHDYMRLCKDLVKYDDFIFISCPE